MKYTYAIAPFNEKTGQIGEVITWKKGTHVETWCNCGDNGDYKKFEAVTGEV